jgi:hypothetical protein
MSKWNNVKNGTNKQTKKDIAYNRLTAVAPSVKLLYIGPG